MAIETVEKYLKKHRKWIIVSELIKEVDMTFTTVQRHLTRLKDIYHQVENKKVWCKKSYKWINAWRWKC